MNAVNATFVNKTALLRSSMAAHNMFSYHGFPIGFLVFQVAALCVTLVLALVGNSLIILAIYRNVNGKMRSTRNLLILNMAISDLISAIFNIPDQLRWLFLGNQVVIDGKVGIFVCLLKDFINTLSIDVSLFSLAFITIDRYLGVFFPLKKYFRRRTVCCITALSWVLPTIYHTPKFAIFDIVDYAGQRSCFMQTPRVFQSTRQFLSYVMAHFVVFQVMPVLLMMVLYPSIAFKLWWRKIPGITQERTRSRAAANNRKITKMFATIILSSVFCYTPLYTNFYDCFYDGFIGICKWKYANYYSAITSLLFFIPLFINSFIYAMFCESFRKAFKEIFQSFCEFINKYLGRTFLSSRSVYEMSSFNHDLSARPIRHRLSCEDLQVKLGTMGTFKVNKAFQNID